MGYDHRKRHDNPWKIYLAKNVYVVPEDIGRAGESVIKKIPKDDT